jgi:hypothetical protein
MSLASYTIEIPETAIIVSDRETLYAAATEFPDSALSSKYGGNIMEVDGRVVLATDEEMTRQINAKYDVIPPLTKEEELKFESESRKMSQECESDTNSTEKRSCSWEV